MNKKMICLALICAAVGACDLQSLTREQLFGAAPDARAAVVDAAPEDTRAPGADTRALADIADARVELAPPDGPEVCSAMGMNGLVSGVVVDACSGQQLDANVGIAGQHLCSFRDKGSFFFRALPTGCRLTLTANKAGYRLHTQTIVVSAQGTADLRIALERDGTSCSVPAPQVPACRCEHPGCTP